MMVIEAVANKVECDTELVTLRTTNTSAIGVGDALGVAVSLTFFLQACDSRGGGGVNQFSFFIGGGGVNEGTSEIGTKKSGRSDSFLLPNRRQRSIDRLYCFLESGVPLNFVFLEFFFVYFFFFYFHRLRSQVRVLQRPPRLGTGWRRASYSRDAVSVLRVRRDLQGRRPLVGRTWRTRQPMTAKGLDYLFLGCPV